MVDHEVDFDLLNEHSLDKTPDETQTRRKFITTPKKYRKKDNCYQKVTMMIMMTMMTATYAESMDLII